MQQRLVQQCGFDRRPAAFEQADEIRFGDGKRFGPRAGVPLRLNYGKAPETARIDEAKLAAAAQREHSVGMRRKRYAGFGDKQPPRHAQVNQKLRRQRFGASVDDA